MRVFLCFLAFATLAFSQREKVVISDPPMVDVDKNTEKIKVNGRIVAHRPADHAFQVNSHALNHELFLFEVSGPRKHRSLGIVQVWYEHVGPSGIADFALDAGIPVKFVLMRKPECDGTLANLAPGGLAVNTSHEQKISSETGLSSFPLLYTLRFVPSFDQRKVSKTSTLKCYELPCGLVPTKLATEGKDPA